MSTFVVPTHERINKQTRENVQIQRDPVLQHRRPRKRKQTRCSCQGGALIPLAGSGLVSPEELQWDPGRTVAVGVAAVGGRAQISQEHFLVTPGPRCAFVILLHLRKCHRKLPYRRVLVWELIMVWKSPT